MIWSGYGIVAARRGNMNINIVAAAKRYVRSMQEKTVSGLWLFSEKLREKFETDRVDYLEETRAVYDQAKTYHDEKWMMFEPKDTTMFNDFSKFLSFKRKPNKI